MARYVVSCDVGFEQDPSSLALVRVWRNRVAEDPETGRLLDPGTMEPLALPEGVTEQQFILPRYDVEDLQRRRRNLTFGAIGREVEAVTRRLVGQGHAVNVLVDATGVGRGAVEAVRQRGIRATPVWFTGGGKVRGNAATTLKVGHRVPYEMLYAALAGGRVAVAQDLPEADQLRQELRACEMQRTATGQPHYQVDLPGSHGDLLVAVAMPLLVHEPKGLAVGAGGEPLHRTVAADNRPAERPRARPRGCTRRDRGTNLRRYLQERKDAENERARRGMWGDPWAQAWDELSRGDD